ncbi:MAG: hypothetical protein JW785_02575 [Acidimicrobiia bacterium]|nr:hypothetical protein [Acidimicrobiia bacterium]
MPDQEMGPHRLVPKGLPGARRGYDRHAVDKLLAEARAAWAALEEEHRRLLTEIDHAGGVEYLGRDLGAVGDEVRRLLADAQEAARGLRERARVDSAERLTAAAAEAEKLVAEGEGQAYRLRAEAWAAAELLLRQADEAHREMIAAADTEVLVIRAEAEQEAHRLVAAAKREAQGITRGARFEAERTVLELRAQPERILPVEPVPVAPAEVPLEEPNAGRSRRRRAAPEPAARAEEVIRVIQPPGARRPVVAGIDPASYGDALAAEVEALRGSGEAEVVPVERPAAPAVTRPPVVAAPVVAAPVEEPVPVEESAGDEGEALPGVEEGPGQEGPLPPGEGAAGFPGATSGVEPAVEETLAPVRAPAGEGRPEGPGPVSAAPEAKKPAGVIDDLFSRLRGAVHRRSEAEEEEAPPPAAKPLDHRPAEPPAPAVDPLELRERLLLPVQNRALRRVKEGIVELHNVALDGLRVSGSWEGAVTALEALTAALDPVAEEGAEAGATAVGRFVGGEAPAPVISARCGGLVEAMAAALTTEVQGAIAEASGAGPLEVAAAVARVFRAWRSEEAERWVRAVAYAAYHDSLLAGLAVVGVKSVVPVASGLLCAACPAGRGLPWDPAGPPPAGTARPPADPDCVCTLAPG